MLASRISLDCQKLNFHGVYPFTYGGCKIRVQSVYYDSKKVEKAIEKATLYKHMIILSNHAQFILL